LRKNLSFVCFLLVILSASIAIQIPLYNRTLIFFDEGIIFNISESVLNGGVVFKDEPSFVLPGIFYLLALLYKVFGVSFLVSRYAMAVVFSATAILVFLISRPIMSELMAFLIALLFVTHRLWAFPVWNMIGYAAFSMFFLAVALLLLLKFAETPQSATVFLVGIFVATAAMFKQDYGGFAGIGMFLYILLWPSLRAKAVDAPEVRISRLKAAGAYIFGGLVVCLPVFAYFAYKGALDDLVQNAFLLPISLETTRETTPLIPLWPLLKQDAFLRGNWLQYAPAVSFMRHLLSWQSATPPGFLYRETPIWEILLKLIHYMPYLTSLATVILLAKHYIKGTFSTKHMKTVAVLIFAVSVFMTQHEPFDFAHLMQMYLPVFLLLGFLADAVYSKARLRKMLFYLALSAGAILMVLYLYHTVAGVSFIANLHSAKLEGPRADIYLSEYDRDSCSEALRFIKENTSSDEPILVLPYHSLFYFLAQRPNPTRFEAIWPVKIFENMDKEIIAASEEKHVEYIVEFPQVHKAIGSYKEFAPEIADYIHNNFAIEKAIGNPYKGLYIRIHKRKHGKI